MSKVKRLVHALLPKGNEPFIGEYDYSHLQEYNGPSYDDPAQLERVRERLYGSPQPDIRSIVARLIDKVRL